MFSWQKLRWTRSTTGKIRITPGTIRITTCKSRFSMPTAHTGSASRILPVVTEPSFLTPWNPQDRTFEVYFGDAGMQDFQAQQGEIPAQAQHDLNVFIDAYAGPENLLDATRLAAL
jgi:hypothetical protein